MSESNPIVTVSLADGMHFQGRTEDKGDYVVEMDADQAVGGQDKGMRPLKMMLVSLGGCMIMDVISILRKKRQDVQDIKVGLRATQAEAHPHVYTQIWMDFTVEGHELDPAAVQRAIDLSWERYCPAANMLKHVVPIEIDFKIVEAAAG
ncbi:MAG: OsmC family protein [Chloroflexi bacterium]|nr:OsmC family protein [Chloroflexota bacterium]